MGELLSKKALLGSSSAHAATAFLPAPAHASFKISTLTGPIRTSLPTVAPSSNIIGVQNTVTPGDYTRRDLAATLNVTHEWRVDGGVDGVGLTHTADAPDATLPYVLWEIAAETGGAFDGVISFPVNLGTIMFAAPTASGTIAARSFTEGTGIKTFDASGFFTFDGTRTYTVTDDEGDPIAGVTINAAGFVSQDTGAMALQVDTPVVIRCADADFPTRFDEQPYPLSIIEAPTAATIDSVVAGPVASDALPVAITATDVANGDNVHWVIVPSADTAPTATEIAAGEASGGGAPTAGGSLLWPNALSHTLASGIGPDDYRVYVVIDNGVLSNVGVSNVVAIDTTEPVAGQALTFVNSSGTFANTENPATAGLPGVATGDWLLVGVTSASGGANDLPFDTLHVEGVAATKLAQPTVTSGFRRGALFKIQCPAAAAGNAAAEFTASLNPDDAAGRYNVFVYACDAEPSVVSSATDVSTTSLDVSLPGTTADNPVVLFAANASDTLTLSGVPEDGTAVALADRKHACGADNNPGGGDRTLTVTAGTGNAVAIAAEIGVVV